MSPLIRGRTHSILSREPGFGGEIPHKSREADAFLAGLAVFLTLAGANLPAGAFMSTGVISSHDSRPAVTVEVTSVRILA